MKEFCKRFVKKTLEVDDKDYLCLKLKKISKKQIKVLREYLNAKLAEFAWEQPQEVRSE